MNERTRGLNMTSPEGWVCPEIIVPEWCDLAINQLCDMYNEDDILCFSFYRTRLLKLLIQAIAERRCINPGLCCEIVNEVIPLEL